MDNRIIDEHEDFVDAREILSELLDYNEKALFELKHNQITNDVFKARVKQNCEWAVDKLEGAIL